jgi:S1-C subfamily serine protease
VVDEDLTAAVASPSPHRRGRILAGATAAVVLLGGGGLALAMHNGSTTNSAGGNLIGSAPSAPAPAATPSPSPSSGSLPFGLDPNSLGNLGGLGALGGGTSGDGSNDPFGQSGSSGASTGRTATATAAQQVGIVDINTTLGLQSAKAAGTGMILTSNGEVLTNNHVINGATSITVTVVSTGTTYKASVVGYSATNDVAVIQLADASGLQTISAAGSLPTVGQEVTGVGNAGGVGGTPSAAPGQVTALDQAITASDEGGGGAERLTGLIETNAPIAAGDSGGPLFDSSNKVLGMDTAASAGGAAQAYAIPIAHALTLAQQIEAGQGSATVHIGATAFLGVDVRDQGGAKVAAVVSGSAAAAAGLVAGDVITSVNGTSVTTADGLSTALAPLTPGQKVSLGWTDASGGSHTGSATLAEGPAK